MASTFGEAQQIQARRISRAGRSLVQAGKLSNWRSSNILILYEQAMQV